MSMCLGMEGPLIHADGRNLLNFSTLKPTPPTSNSGFFGLCAPVLNRTSRRNNGTSRLHPLVPSHMWVVVKIRVPFWIPITKQHLIFRVPEKGS